MKKHKISYEELLQNRIFKDYREEYEYVIQLINDKKVSPIKNSGTNGKRPAMYKYFWLLESNSDYSYLISELQYSLHPNINPEYYLSYPEVYEYERDFVIALSDYFTRNKADLNVMISENERSYAIWHLEKFLSGKTHNVNGHDVSAALLLKHCGLKKEDLKVYHTMEPLAYYSYSKETLQNILILENLDPFYSIRMKMMSGENNILGTDFSTLIYGSGKKVSSVFSGFELFAEDYLKDKRNNFFYFGDLDYEGIIIFESLQERMKGIINIEPFKAAYEELIKDYDKVLLPQTKDLQNKNIGNEFWKYFDFDQKNRMLDVLESGRYIPQEKLSILDYTL